VGKERWVALSASKKARLLEVGVSRHRKTKGGMDVRSKTATSGCVEARPRTGLSECCRAIPAGFEPTIIVFFDLCFLLSQDASDQVTRFD